MNIAYILTGGNLGNRLINMERAQKYLEEDVGKIARSSKIYETAAWGNSEQPDFYNQVHIVKTNLSAQEVMQSVLLIEEKMGRVRTFKNAARIIDIDILFFNNDIINSINLVVPHPEIANRRFVLEPLNELSPQFMHPVLHKTIKELLSTCKDMLKVTPVKN
ncbi:MAG: 2-amino-4-hydroxy-6-hydroxymethyldihydropteridine diphosphokinase [Ginsengibacter sp.]